MEGFVFQNGKWLPRVGVSFSILENGFPELGFHFPFWKTVSQGWGSILHFGKWFPRVGVSFSILENGTPRFRNAQIRFREGFSAKRILLVQVS